MSVDVITQQLAGHCYVFSNELGLHECVAEVLEEAGIAYRREHSASRADRFDFLTDDGIVIEAKVDGSLPDALRQVDRYLKHDEVAGAVIASAKHWARTAKPALTLRGKPVAVVHLKRAAF